MQVHYIYMYITTLQDKVVAFQKISTMYIKYVLAFRKLEECYDQIVHPQKRRLIRHMLDGTIGRYIHVYACIHLQCMYSLEQHLHV